MVYKIAAVLAGPLPTTTTTTITTTHAQLALVAALPCLSMESHVTVDDLSDSQEDDQMDVHVTLIKLGSVVSDVKDVLSVFLNEVVPYTWGSHGHTGLMHRLRSRLQFRWTVDGTDEMSEQETERLESLIRISGYILFLDTAITTRTAKDLYHTSGLALLETLKVETEKAACQVRNLLLNFSSRTIHTKALGSTEPNGLSALKRVLSSNAPQQIARMITGLALQDMNHTFSNMDITSTGISLGKK